jgi:hypothetical protein
MTRRSLVSHVMVVVSVACGMLAVVSTQTACSSLTDSLCKPTSRSAGVTILSAWCERYTRCDAKRGTVADCVDRRLGIGQVPTEDGCAASCSDDMSCHRSTCKQEQIDKCKADSFAMACAEQESNSLVRFPLGCDSCFSN